MSWSLSREGSGLSPHLEDDIPGLEEVVVQTEAGGGQTLQGRAGQQRDVGGGEVGEELVVRALSQTHLHSQANLGGAAALHTDQVEAKQKGIEDLLPGLISPEPGECSHYCNY